MGDGEKKDESGEIVAQMWRGVRRRYQIMIRLITPYDLSSIDFLQSSKLEATFTSLSFHHLFLLPRRLQLAMVSLGMSRTARISLLLVIDVCFFFVELFVGQYHLFLSIPPAYTLFLPLQAMQSAPLRSSQTVSIC